MRNLTRALRDEVVRPPSSVLGLLEAAVSSTAHPMLSLILSCEGGGTFSPRRKDLTILELLRSETDAMQHPTLRAIIQDSRSRTIALHNRPYTSLLSQTIEGRYGNIDSRYPTLEMILLMGNEERTKVSYLNLNPKKHPTLLLIMSSASEERYTTMVGSAMLCLLESLTTKEKYPTLHKIFRQRLTERRGPAAGRSNLQLLNPKAAPAPPEGTTASSQPQQAQTLNPLKTPWSVSNSRLSADSKKSFDSTKKKN